MTERLTHYNKAEKYYDVKKAYLCDIDEYDGETWINTYSAYQKLGELEDIEQELGISLKILFKVIKEQSAWTYYKGEYEESNIIEYMLGEDFIYFYFDSGKHLVFELKDYGKSWALTKEELEND